MKKLLALGLSLAMMASLSAVAFAAEITGPQDPNTPQSADVLVRTKLDEQNPAKDDTFTVTIPTTPQDIPWGTDPVNVDLNVKVDGQMIKDSTVTVTAEAVNELANGNDKLPVTMGENLNFVVTGAQLAAPQTSTGFAITAVDWDAAPVVGEYSHNFVYTVAYEAGMNA